MNVMTYFRDPKTNKLGAFMVNDVDSFEQAMMDVRLETSAFRVFCLVPKSPQVEVTIEPEAA